MSYLTTEQKNKLLAMRKALDNFVVKIVDSTTEINENVGIIRKWVPGNYVIGDVRLYENIPYKCVQAHDSALNPDWNPNVQSLWMQYHGTSIETARPWIAPVGAHDMYKFGEYMIWTDGKVYCCKQDTVYSPDAYSQAWEVIE